MPARVLLVDIDDTLQKEIGPVVAAAADLLSSVPQVPPGKVRAVAEGLPEAARQVKREWMVESPAFDRLLRDAFIGHLEIMVMDPAYELGPADGDLRGTADIFRRPMEDLVDSAAGFRRQAWKKALEAAQCQVPERVLERLGDDRRFMELRFMKNFRPEPRAQALLAALESGRIRYQILSNGSEASQESKCRALKIPEERRAYSGGIGFAKPHPMALVAAAKAAGIDLMDRDVVYAPRGVLVEMLGDNPLTDGLGVRNLVRWLDDTWPGHKVKARFLHYDPSLQPFQNVQDVPDWELRELEALTMPLANHRATAEHLGIDLPRAASLEMRGLR